MKQNKNKHIRKIEMSFYPISIPPTKKYKMIIVNRKNVFINSESLILIQREMRYSCKKQTKNKKKNAKRKIVQSGKTNNMNGNDANK